MITLIIKSEKNHPRQVYFLFLPINIETNVIKWIKALFQAVSIYHSREVEVDAFAGQIDQSLPVNIDHLIFPSINGMRWLICSGVDR
jgi:hypothetical protein